MVEDTGKAAGADTVRPVNMPEPVHVEEGVTGSPLAIKGRRRQKITGISDRWRIDDEWWRAEPVSRMYFSLVLDSGQRLVVYRDLCRGGWYKQGY